MDDDIQQMQKYRFEYALPGSGLSLVVDNQLREARVGAEPLHLEPLVFRLLNILLVRAGRLVSREDLLRFLERDPQHGHDAGGRVLNNAVSALRRSLKAAFGPDGPAPIKTGKNGYYFEGQVVAEAQIAEAPGDGPALMPGDHLPTARGVLIERLYINHGIECWAVRASRASEPDRRVRVAVSALGARRLRHEKAVHDVIQLRMQDEQLTLPPEANMAMPFHQTLSWPLSVRSLEERGRDGGCLHGLPLKDRLFLAEQVVARVARLHQIGIVHGDLKASNVWLHEANDRTVYLGGFAHAYVKSPSNGDGTDAEFWLQEHDWRRHREDSAHYQAPELPDTMRKDELSDVYALGVLLYKIVGGDITLPFSANWQDDVDCPVLQEDIAAATARLPEDRIQSAADLLERLTRYGERRHEHDREAEHLARFAEESERLKRHRIRRPLYLAVLATLAIGLVGVSVLAIRLKHSNDEIAVQAERAEAARDVLRSILVSADPRAGPAGPPESVDDVLERAAGTAPLAYVDDPGGAAGVHLVLADVYRGRGNLAGELRHLDQAVTLLEETDSDPARLAGAKYAYSASLLLVRPEPGVDPSVHRKAAMKEITEADRLFGEISTPSIALRAARAFARGNLSSQRGDFQSTYAGLDPWMAIMRESSLPLDRKANNSVVLYAEAQLRLGKPEAALETLDWLASKEPGQIPGWLTVNRRTMQAQISGVLDRPDTEIQFRAALDFVNDIYGGRAVPEANIRHYFGNYLEAKGRLREAEDQQRRAQSIFCDLAAAPLYCEGLDLSIGGLQLKAGRYDEALAKFERARQAFERYFPAGLAQVNYAMAMAHLGKGDPARARSFLSGLTVSQLEAADPRGDWGVRLAAITAISAARPRTEDVSAAIQELRDASVDAVTIEWLEAAASRVLQRTRRGLETVGT